MIYQKMTVRWSEDPDEYRRQYMKERNKRVITCECGVSMKISSVYVHRQTPKHKITLENIQLKNSLKE
jgi:hypothetical protein